MRTFTAFFRRIFRRTPPPAPRLEYWPESSLPTDAGELIRAGVIREWRTMAATGEPWFSSERGSIQWFIENLAEGARDDA
ncbi:MAG: hypothetical protein GX575_33805 [Candidatus Anammoximicrobium sp.]|nr:hypothetical protein [Candidatus Anammoximicrobium sp.]